MRRSLLTVPQASGPTGPEFVAAGSATSNFTAVPKPAGVQAGDLLFVVASRSSNPPPSGFSFVWNGSGCSVYARVADGTEPAAFSTSASGDGIAVAVAYRGLGPTVRVTGYADASGTTLTYPALASLAGDTVIGFGCGTGINAFTTPAGHTERVGAFVSLQYDDHAVQVVDLLPATGAVGSVTATGAASRGFTSTSGVRAAYPPA